MKRSVFAKAVLALLLLFGAALLYAKETQALSLPQLFGGLAVFLLLAFVAALLNAKPRTDLQSAKALSGKGKAPAAKPKDLERATPVAKPLASPVAPGFDPHDGASVAIMRHRRIAGFDVTCDGTSWFGGLPALGPADWPTAQSGHPMSHLAQIDLASLASKIASPGLPLAGSLAFFANVSVGPLQGAVRYVPGNQIKPTQPPAGLQPLEDNSMGGPLWKGEEAQTQLLYPRMAIDMVALPGIATDDEDQATRLEDLLGPKRENGLSLSSFPDQFPGGAKPFNRDCVARFALGAGLSLANGEEARGKLEKAAADCRNRLAGLTQRLPDLTLAAQLADADAPAIEALRLAQAQLAQATTDTARMEYQLAHFDQERAALQRSVTAMADWAARANRWAMLSDAEQAEITPLLARWTGSYSLGYLHLAATWSAHRRMQDAASETLHAMAVAPDGVFALLPQAVQTALNGPYRQPIWGLRHQMFGPPQSVQSAAEDYSDHYLLLQINTDDLQGFSWGDMAVLQFWIRPADLLAGNWSAVKFSLESH